LRIRIGGGAEISVLIEALVAAVEMVNSLMLDCHLTRFLSFLKPNSLLLRQVGNPRGPERIESYPAIKQQWQCKHQTRDARTASGRAVKNGLPRNRKSSFRESL
jgi:hypothetical protein